MSASDVSSTSSVASLPDVFAEAASLDESRAQMDTGLVGFFALFTFCVLAVGVNVFNTMRPEDPIEEAIEPVPTPTGMMRLPRRGSSQQCFSDLEAGPKRMQQKRRKEKRVKFPGTISTYSGVPTSAIARLQASRRSPRRRP